MCDGAIVACLFFSLSFESFLTFWRVLVPGYSGLYCMNGQEVNVQSCIYVSEVNCSTPGRQDPRSGNVKRRRSEKSGIRE